MTERGLARNYITKCQPIKRSFDWNIFNYTSELKVLPANTWLLIMMLHSRPNLNKEINSYINPKCLQLVCYEMDTCFHHGERFSSFFNRSMFWFKVSRYAVEKGPSMLEGDHKNKVLMKYIHYNIIHCALSVSLPVTFNFDIMTFNISIKSIQWYLSYLHRNQSLPDNERQLVRFRWHIRWKTTGKV